MARGRPGCWLKNEFQGELDLASAGAAVGTDDRGEGFAERGVAGNEEIVRLGELRVIEEVVDFRTKLQL